MKKTRIVTRIEPVPVKRRKLLIAPYCRVSTAHESQRKSLENQREHYLCLVEEHPDWELADIYLELGASGTQVEGRPEFARLIRDCQAGRVDMVLTKSISRFARNTRECLEMVRELTALGVAIHFEKERICTEEVGTEFFLTILASLAEEESRSISQNEKWAAKKRFQGGEFKFSNPPYGYKVVKGKLRIQRDQAKVVRWMYERVLAGEGTARIARQLNEKGIPTKSGKGSWHASTVMPILKNVVNKGDLLMQKTWTDEDLKRHANRGQEPQYYMDHHHEPIVSPDIFDQAMEMIERRGSNNKGSNENIEEDQGSISEKAIERGKKVSVLSGKIICAECGRAMKRIYSVSRGKKIPCRICKNRIEGLADCHMQQIPEKNIEQIFCRLLTRLSGESQDVLKAYLSEGFEAREREERQKTEEVRRQMAVSKEQLDRLSMLYSTGCINSIEYQHQKMFLEQAVQESRQDIFRMKEDNPCYSEGLALCRYLKIWEGKKRKTFPAEAFARYVEKVMVSGPEDMTFYLSCGLVIRENITPRREHKRRKEGAAYGNQSNTGNNGNVSSKEKNQKDPGRSLLQGIN